MLDVLDQHQPTARTVASLRASAVSAQLDPASRTDRLSRSRLRRAALISAAIAAPLALVLAPFGYQVWQDSYWHPAADEPLETAAFSPHTDIMVTAFGEAIDGVDMVWDVTDLSRPRRLSQFEGGQPMALSPDGRTVATIAYSGQAALWNVADPRRPVKMTTLSDGDGSKLEELAFSPDGQILATARYDKIFLWDMASPARPARTATVRGLLTRAHYPSGSPQPEETPLCATCQPASYAVAFTPDGHALTVVVDREEMSANSGRDTIFDWHVTSAGTLGAGTAAARDVADFQPVIAPGDRTVLGSPPGSHAWHAWPLPLPAQPDACLPLPRRRHAGPGQDQPGHRPGATQLTIEGRHRTGRQNRTIGMTPPAHPIQPSAVQIRQRSARPARR